MACGDIIKGRGTVVMYAAVGETPSETIGKIQSISGPAYSITVRDVTNMDSPGNAMESDPGDEENVQLTMTVLHTIEVTVDLHSIRGVCKSWEVALPDNTGYTFDGFISNITPTISTSESVTNEVTIQTTGTVTYYNAGS